jgi:hypothetical protein
MRIINNTGDPLIHADGTVLAGVNIYFTLIDRTTKRPLQQFDILTHEWVEPSPLMVTTDANGEFTINLWQNARGNIPTIYKIVIDHEDVKPFYGYITDSTVPTTLYQIAQDYVSTVIPTPFDNLALHANDFDLHLTGAQNTWIDGITATQAELNIMNGIIATTAQINTLASSAVTNADFVKLHAIISTVNELNILAGIPAGLTSTELGYVDGVTSAIQGQIDLKSPIASPVFTTRITTPILKLGATDVTATAVELNRCVGVTSAIQTQLNNKLGQSVALPTGTLSGFTTLPTLNIKAVRSGDAITLSLLSFTGISNSTACSWNGTLAAEFWPITTVNFPIWVIDNGVTVIGIVTVTAAGVISFSSGPSGGFSAVGTKGILGTAISYTNWSLIM